MSEEHSEGCKPLTTLQKEMYLWDPTKCPVCGANELNDYDFQDDSGSVGEHRFLVECLCGASWVTISRLSSVAADNFGDEEVTLPPARYLLVLEGVEISLLGPYTTSKARLLEAREVRKSVDDNTAVHWLDVAARGIPEVGDYRAGEVDPAFADDWKNETKETES